VDASVIIVNYNTGDILADCLRSVLSQTGVSFDVIVIDNASQDNSVTVLESFADSIEIILNGENSGFGKANNLAFQRSNGRYIFLLNPDALFTTSADLQNIVAFMDAHTEYGLAGTRLFKSQTQTEGHSFLSYPGQRYLTRSLPSLPGHIAWVLGASMIIRRNVYEQSRGFDEDYFLYGEEADLCLRIRKLGYAIGFCKNVVISHIGGASERSVDIEAIQIKKQRGLHLFYCKHYDPIDVVRLVKRDRRRALLRLALIKAKKMFFQLTERQRKRYCTYKAVFRCSTQFLATYQKKN
jgi:GT2 family glycosyltransferase